MPSTQPFATLTPHAQQKSSGFHGQLAPLAHARSQTEEDQRRKAGPLVQKGAIFGAIKGEGSCLNNGWRFIFEQRKERRTGEEEGRGK